MEQRWRAYTWGGVRVALRIFCKCSWAFCIADTFTGGGIFLPPHPLQRPVTVDGPPSLPIPSCEEPEGVLKIETGSVKIDIVGVLLRDSRLSSRQHMFLPLPLPPPRMRWGGGMRRRVYSLSQPKGRLHRFEQFWDIPHEWLGALLGQCRAKYEIMMT